MNYVVSSFLPNSAAERYVEVRSLGSREDSFFSTRPIRCLQHRPTTSYISKHHDERALAKHAQQQVEKRRSTHANPKEDEDAGQEQDRVAAEEGCGGVLFTGGREAKDRDAKKRASSVRTHAREEEDSLATSLAAAVQPGAVVVGGSDREGGYDDEEEAVGTARPGNVETSTMEDGSAPLVVESYAVTDEATGTLSDDELRRRILESTARAEAVVPIDSNKDATKSRRFWMWTAMGAIVLAAAFAVGVAVPLSRQASPSSQSTAPDESVVASITYIEWQGAGGFAYSVRAETRETGIPNDPYATSGVVEIVGCKPKVCTESDSNCVVGTPFVPGCCAGLDCPNATKCGDSCPPSPESCYLTHPENQTCLQPECYTCRKVNGQDAYVLQNIAFAIDCLQVGTSIRSDNQQEYKWAIFCGPMISGGIPEENRDLGEYQCGAFRMGANYSDEHGGLEAANYPCQYLALAECGCGPSDIYTFGLPEPTGPCDPDNGTCPLLCEDAGPQYARNLCRSFPGNISYWEGRNVFNSTLFYEGLMAPKYQLDIYIKGVDN